MRKTPPRIVVTPTPEDAYNCSIMSASNSSIDSSDCEKSETLSMLSQKLNEFNTNKNDDKKYSGDDDKISDDDFIEESIVENDVESSSDDLLISSSSSDDDSESEFENIGLQAIRSVTNVNVYNEKNAINNNDDDDDTDSDDNDDLSEDLETIEGVSSYQLSVIYEESAAKERKDSQHSNASTLSDCSTTIANDDDDQTEVDEEVEEEDEEEEVEEEEEEDEKNEADEIKENLVTVRLPLRLSFSRSSNDEEVTTVVVGKSEYKDDVNNNLMVRNYSFNNLQESTSENDISVTLSIPSRGSSMERSCLSKTPSIDRPSSRMGDYEDSDSEVSVNISLPMRRNKFFGQTMLRSDTCNDISVPEIVDEIIDDTSSDEDCDEEFEERIELEEIKEEEEEEEIIIEKSKPKLKLIMPILKKTPEIIESPKWKCNDVLSTIKQNESEEVKISVKDRIMAFETTTTIATPQQETPVKSKPPEFDNKKLLFSRNNSSFKSSIEESELDEDDSGVTSDLSRHNGTDTESECFPELRKMSRYQRAATHSRLFKLLQDECDTPDEEEDKSIKFVEPPVFVSRPKKIVHNVSITRKQNPNAIKEAETVSQRRERLSLPIYSSNSIDADSVSSSCSSSSPVNDKLVNELVQSLLLKKKSPLLSSLPLKKLQAVAKRVLQEELDYNDTFSSSDEIRTVDSTPALTPQEFQNGYSEYYDSFDQEFPTYDILPSKAFKNLQEQSSYGQKKAWALKCPRVLSSKKVNRDLSRVAEIRESVSPDPIRSSSPFNCKTMSDGSSNNVLKDRRYTSLDSF